MKIDELFEKYIEMFGEGFPSYQVLRDKTDEEACAIVQECIDKGLDAYEIGFCTDDMGVKY